MSDTQRTRLYQAIESRDADAVRSILAQSPEIREAPVVGNTWLEQAAGAHGIETVKVLLELGFSINAQSGREGSTPLMWAINSGDVAMTRYLLSRGADPNLDRPLIAAISQDDEAVGLELVQILVRAGADINTFFPWFGDPSKGFTPLGWAEVNQRMDIASYLRVATREQPAGRRAGQHDEVVAHFERAFGPVSPAAFTGIVPTAEVAVTVHTVPAGRVNGMVTIFTSGMSGAPMHTPPGEEAYQFAELYIQFPAGWLPDGDTRTDPSVLWPYVWMRAIASYVHNQETWLGGQVAVISAETSNVSVPNSSFVAMLLLADSSFVRSDQTVVHLYRMMPIYREEYLLEQRQGIDALLRAFDRSGTPMFVDLERTNVGL